MEEFCISCNRVLAGTTTVQLMCNTENPDSVMQFYEYLDVLLCFLGDCLLWGIFGGHIDITSRNLQTQKKTCRGLCQPMWAIGLCKSESCPGVSFKANMSCWMLCATVEMHKLKMLVRFICD